MLNRTPTNTSNTINAYRKKRQQKGPFLMYGAIALVVIGFILLVVWLTRPGQPLGQLLATDTPTPTVTFTATTTSTPSVTPTITETPTQTLTPTLSGPVTYTVQEGDSLDSIAQKFNLGENGILLIYNENLERMEANQGVIYVGDTLTIPEPGRVLPTSSPIPADMPRGRLVDYRILPGDTLAGIAVRFNSVAEEIVKVNNIEDANALNTGDVIKVPVNLVTPTATLPSTSTPVTPTVAGGQPTAAATTAATTAAATSSSSASSSGSGTAACGFQENAQYVSQLQKLINDERAKAGLPALVINSQLSAAAKAHATDMICKNYLSHIGLDGSTPEDRVEKAGFTASLVVEDLFALHPAYGGNPQAAFDWWMSDPTSKADLLNPNTTVFGIAYTSMDQSLLGGYFVVVSAKP